MTDLKRLHFSGPPRAIGRALGEWGRRAVQDRLCHHPLWREVTDARHRKKTEAMAALTARDFPWITEEIDGMAEGLGLPFHQVFAWNCRGDLLASVPDGCTSLLYPGPVPVLAHNEDGLPFLRGACGIVEIAPEAAPGFAAFCYPGSIPGHTFAATSAGMAQTVNNIRLTCVGEGLPRMVLGRAVLAEGSVAAAVEMLRAHPAAGGFHFALADARSVLSVEFGGGAVSVQPVTAPLAHANHALHLGLPQRITDSSHDRKLRAGALLDGHAALDILRDRAGPGLPIHRGEPDDPDEENTLATALIRVEAEAVAWAVHDGPGPAVHTGRVKVG